MEGGYRLGWMDGVREALGSREMRDDCEGCARMRER